jgi:hypothetical protein
MPRPEQPDLAGTGAATRRMIDGIIAAHRNIPGAVDPDQALERYP